MPRRINNESIESRCKKLESYGFKCIKDDYVVQITPSLSLEVDFSTVKSDNFLHHAITRVWQEGVIKGRSAMQEDFKQLFNLNKDLQF